MKLAEQIRRHFRRQPPSADELAARAEAQSSRDQIRETEAELKTQIDAKLGGGDLTPPPPF